MKKTILILSTATLATICFQSCSKSTSIGKNDANKNFFDSWIQIYHPEAKEENGIFILDEKQGTGEVLRDVEKDPYVTLSFTVCDLDGNIVETTRAEVAQQLGTYSESGFYGPTLTVRRQNVMKAGLEKILEGMRAGGTKKAVVPGWFDTKKWYESDKEYFEKESGTDYIYDVKLEEIISDLKTYQIDSIENYLSHNFSFKVDSTMFGYYYIQTKAPSDTASFGKEATVKVNYTGRLLNGLVFDTTDKDTAKDAYLYTAGKDYAPYEVELQEDYTDMETVQGFSYCISKMKKGEKGICIFYSGLGYGGSGQSSIPAYSPLRFDIEMLGTK